MDSGGRPGGIAGRFEWRGVTTEYRDVLVSSRGAELRFMVNRERIHDAVTGETVTRSIIRHPGVVVMVPVLDDGRILLVRQFRYPVDAELWELPAGTLAAREDGGRPVAVETPEDAAARELVEETGYAAGRIEKVAEWLAMPGGNDLCVHLYVVRDLARRAQALEHGEVIDEVRAFAPAELEAMITRGDIRDAKTLVGLFLVLARRPDGVRIA
jgi:ADP-ribose diphosphatase